jgi:cytochrome c oxidase assembly protein subunit 11
MGGAGTKRKNGIVAGAVLTVVFAMVGMSFAAVPLYALFCRVTGYDGTTQRAESAPGQVIDRPVTVRLNADTAPNLPWRFAPEVREVTLKLGETSLVSYRAENRSGQPVTGTAVYNVTPEKAGRYFNKIECFCFGEQTLEPGQAVDMPVSFFIDPAMAADRSMDDVQTITLSYSFFRARSKELDGAVERFQTRESKPQKVSSAATALPVAN